MAITHVQLFSVPVTDQDRACDFHVGALRFDLVADTPMGPGQRWVQVAPQGAQTAMTLVVDFAIMPAGSPKGLVLETDDLEGDIARFRDRAVHIEADIEEQAWGRWVTSEDPDGNGIILQASAPVGTGA